MFGSDGAAFGSKLESREGPTDTPLCFLNSQDFSEENLPEPRMGSFLLGKIGSK
jgi:hypothetical protein